MPTATDLPYATMSNAKSVCETPILRMAKDINRMSYTFSKRRNEIQDMENLERSVHRRASEAKGDATER